LRTAVADLSWLLSRGYAEPSALKIVGDRYRLVERQRMAVRRCACSDQSLARRRRHEIHGDHIRGGPVILDGFNVLTTLEAALGGAVVLIGRDGAARDLAGVHGTYRRVEETRPAITLVGRFLEERHVSPCLWLLDRPVSNSGRLKAILEAMASEHGWNWAVGLELNPDAHLAASRDLVATADAGILDQCDSWMNLALGVIRASVPGCDLVDLGTAS
jgi:hypothetical protein